MIIDTTEIQDINSFYRVESLKEIYGIIWVLVPILTLVLGITIGVLVIVWLEREISIGLQQRISKIIDRDIANRTIAIPIKGVVPQFGAFLFRFIPGVEYLIQELFLIQSAGINRKGKSLMIRQIRLGY